MAFTGDLSIFFNTNDFGVTASYAPQLGASTSFVGILDKEFVISNGVESEKPVFHCAASSLPTDRMHGDRIVIGSTPYQVVGVENDNTGVTKLILEEQDI